MSLPKSMRYVSVAQAGDAQQMHIDQGALPAYSDNEVLIKVHYAGVNRPDIFQRKGQYPPPKGASAILGLEVSGEIIAAGQAASQWREGDLVCALANGGGYAEYVSVPASQCLPIPRGLSLEQAASLPETFFTVWSTVFMEAQLQSQERFLVHGGSSGIGVAAIQLAKAFGARVFTTAGSDEKCEFCRSIGADVAVNYRTQDFVEVIQSSLDKHKARGINVVLDMVAGDYVQRNLSLCAEDARVTIIAGLRGYKAELNLLPLMTKRIKLSGATLRPRSSQYKARIAQDLKHKVWPLIEDQQIKPVIEQVFELEKVSKAHQLMESGEHIGKIMLKVA